MPTDPPLKGLSCPECRGVRLTVYSSRRPGAGVKLRYRKCSACGCRVKTREVVVPIRPRKSKSPPDAA
jgi:transcriptional regulator NrdR family protein